MPASTKPRVGAVAPKPGYKPPDATSAELRHMLNNAIEDFVTTAGLASEAQYRTSLLEVIARGVIGVLEVIEARS